MKTRDQKRCDRRMVKANELAAKLGVGKVHPSGGYCWVWKNKAFSNYSAHEWGAQRYELLEKNGLELVVMKPETIRQIIGPDAKGVPARYMAFLMTGEVPKELCFDDDTGE